MVTRVVKFKVVTVSKNTNGFGLFGVVLVAADGTAFEAAHGQIGCPAKDDVLEVVKQGRDYLWGKHGFEIPQELPTCPPDAVLTLWGFVETPEEPRKAEDYIAIVATIEDWALLFETLNVDVQSNSFERELRAQIAAALDRVETVPPEHTQTVLDLLDQS